MPKKLNRFYRVYDGGRLPYGRRFYGYVALWASLLSAPMTAGAITWEVMGQLQANQAATMKSHVVVTPPLWIGNGTPHLNVTGGLTGIRKAPAGARLDVQSSGSGTVQIWRNSGGTQVASMPDTGVMNAYTGVAVSGAVMFFNLASCPSGWSELTAARGRYVVGRPSGGTLAGTQGTQLSNLESRAVGQHLHPINDSGHTHSMEAVADYARCCFYNGSSIYDTLDGGSTGSSYTGITQTQNTGSSGTNAPYIQLLICQKN